MMDLDSENGTTPYLLDSPPYGADEWLRRGRKGRCTTFLACSGSKPATTPFSLDVAKMKSRRFPWHLPGTLIRERFVVTDDGQRRGGASSSPHPVAIRPNPSTPVLITHNLSGSYNHCEQCLLFGHATNTVCPKVLQRANMTPAAGTHTAVRHPPVLLGLRPAESVNVLTLLLIAIHLHLDASIDPRS